MGQRGARPCTTGGEGGTSGECGERRDHNKPFVDISSQHVGLQPPSISILFRTKQKAQLIETPPSPPSGHVPCHAA